MIGIDDTKQCLDRFYRLCVFVLVVSLVLFLAGCIIKLDDDSDQRDIRVKVKADCDGPCLIDIDTSRSVNRVTAKKEAKPNP